MKTFIKITADERAFGNGEVVYKDAQGNECLGKQISAPIGRLVCVEISNSPLEDGFYHIVKVVA